MQFRWVAFITLWTFLVGPILSSPPGAREVAQKRPAAVAKHRAASVHGPRAQR